MTTGLKSRASIQNRAGAPSYFSLRIDNVFPYSTWIYIYISSFHDGISVVQDGKRCKNAVNVSQCRFCEFHVAAEFRKLQPKRGQFMDSMLSTAFRRGPVLKQQTHRGESSLLRGQESGIRVQG